MLCFEKVWPKKIHGLGVTREKELMQLPFHSCDSSTWNLRPTAFGKWPAFGNVALSTKGAENQDLTVELEYNLRIERKIQQRWAHEMKKLDPDCPFPLPDVKLAYFPNNRVDKVLSKQNYGRRYLNEEMQILPSVRKPRKRIPKRKKAAKKKR
jgi:hypothetical protein